MSISLFIGGTRSGKSILAEKAALNYQAPRLYVATAVPTDDEMEKRIAAHKERRKGLFDTIEEALFLNKVFSEKNNHYNIVMIDCLTFWYNNLFFYFDDSKKRENVADLFLDSLRQTKTAVILVTNEVGLSVVPENKLAREFIDFSGKINQKIASICHDVYFVVAGKKMRLE